MLRFDRDSSEYLLMYWLKNWTLRCPIMQLLKQWKHFIEVQIPSTKVASDRQIKRVWIWYDQFFIFKPLNEVFLNNISQTSTLLNNLTFTNLLLFCRGEIIFDVESLPNLLWGFSFDHICYSLAGYIKESLENIGNQILIGSGSYCKLKFKTP